jgi:hypothetical protein
MAKAVLLATTLLFVCAAVHADAQDHLVPKKFSVQPPEGWRPNDPSVTQAAAKQAAKSIGMGGLMRGKPPLAVFLSANASLGFASNLNIREVEEVRSVNAEFMEEYRKNMSKGFGGMKIAIENVEAIHVGGRQAMRADWSYTMAGIPLRVVQVFYPGRGVSFISTYTVHASAWAGERPSIEASIESFRNREPWYAWITGRPIVLYALIGAGVGLLAALLKLAFRRN